MAAARGSVHGGARAARVADATLALAVVALPVLRHPPMASNLLLISRKEGNYGPWSQIRLVTAPSPALDLKMLGWLIDCPPEEIEFSRVGPIELAHGGASSQRQHLESLRWPLLDQPVIHGKAVGIRTGVRWPGEAPEGEPIPMRPLTEWEGANALRWFQDQALPLQLCSCPIHKWFLDSIGWPQRSEFEAADPAGKVRILQAEHSRRRAAREALAPVLEALLTSEGSCCPIGSRS